MSYLIVEASTRERTAYTQMIKFLRNRVFLLLFALTLPSNGMALQEYNQIVVSFSILSPVGKGNDRVYDSVSVALRSFFCENGKLSLLDSQYRSVCYRRARGGETAVFSQMAKLSMLEFIQQTDPIRSYLSDDPIHMLIVDTHDGNGSFDGSTWDMSYEVLQVGSIDAEKARVAGLDDEQSFMEFRLQSSLNVSIMEGDMNERLKGTGILMGLVGQEWEFLSDDSSMVWKEENIDADPELDYRYPALVLRYIGIVLLIGSVASSIILTYMGRQYRLNKERTEKEFAFLRDPELQTGLVTAEGVNMMLEIGRRESERVSSTTGF